tara:strand:+ start:150 stop:335 length:186 start_codon:yes stop_codon:yes gene_type:complete
MELLENQFRVFASNIPTLGVHKIAFSKKKAIKKALQNNAELFLLLQKRSVFLSFLVTICQV